MATSNTLTGLIGTVYKGLDTVAQEPVAIIDSVNRNSGAEQAAVGQTITYPVTTAQSSTAITPGMEADFSGGQTITYGSMTLTAMEKVEILWSGEEQLQVDESNNGPGYYPLLADQFAQAFRTLRNKIESQGGDLYKYGSRSVTPAGTNLFDATTQLAFRDIANVEKLCIDNGVGDGTPLTLVLSTSAGAALAGNSVYNSKDYGNGVDTTRRGTLYEHLNVRIKRSSGIKSTAIGTGSGLKTDSTGYAVGTTSITVATDGSGTIVAGDTITFSGDATGSKYVVLTGGDMGSGGTVVIAAPGLRGALAASQSDITIVDKIERNMCFSQNAIVLATRVPKVPVEGDKAIDSMTVQDKHTGLVFSIRKYAGYYCVKYEVSIAWGWKVVKPEFLNLLLG